MKEIPIPGRPEIQPVIPQPEAKAHPMVLIELPMPPFVEGGYMPVHLDIGSITPAQARNLRRLTMGLQIVAARQANGRPVVDMASAVRYLLERLGDA